MTNSDPVHTDDARFLQLLERWLQGDFNRSDERELYALTETDDFRREAWEGFAALPEGKHEIHLEALRRRLRPKPGRRAPMGMWAAVAAVFVALVFAVYFLPGWLKKEAAPMAQQTEPAAPALQNMTGARDSMEADIAIVDESGDRSKAKPGSKRFPALQPAAEITLFDDLAVATEDAGPDMKKDAESVVTPIPPSTVSDSFKTRYGGPAANQQQIPAPATVPGGAEQDIATKPEVVRYDPSPTQPADAVRAKAAENAKKAGRPEAKEKQEEEVVQVASATPVGGWDNFQRYLRNTARLPNAARNNNVSGYVRLQFEVGQDGKPGNFKVLHPLGYGCDEEAIRLINSVRWTPGGPGATAVEVPFVR